MTKILRIFSFLLILPVFLHAQTWTTSGPMAGGRFLHSATLLQNGKILVVGGSNGTTNYTSAFTYNPVDNTWASAGNLSAGRTNHTSTLLPDGKVLVVAGTNTAGTVVNSAEIYDPIANAWALLPATLNAARGGHCAVLLKNGKVLISSGFSPGAWTVIASCELFDPVTQTFSFTGSMTNARQIFSATLMGDGRVIASGGWGGGDRADSEIYDPVTGTWGSVITYDVSMGGEGHTILLANGKVLGAVVSGTGPVTGSQFFDPGTNTWTLSGNLPTPVEMGALSLLTSGKVLLSGGRDGTTSPTNICQLYDGATGLWTVTTPLNAARFWHSSTILPDGRVIVIGGYNGTAALNSVEVFQQAVAGWSAATPLPFVAKANYASILLPNNLVLFSGGSTDIGTTPSSVCALYDYSTGVWSITGPMNTPRLYHTLTLLPDGKVLAAGGANPGIAPHGGVGTVSCEIYDPATGIWTNSGNLNIARYSFCTTLLFDGKVLATGGGIDNTTSTNTAEIYDPATGTWKHTKGNMIVLTGGNHTATLLPDGKVLVARGGTVATSSELFDPCTETFTVTGNFPVPAQAGYAIARAHLLGNGKVLYFGGIVSSSTGTSSSFLYDYLTGTWTATGNMVTPRYTHSSSILPNGKVLAVGGFSGSYYNKSEIYDPVTGTWTATPDMVAARSRANSTLLPDGKVLTSGGADPSILSTCEIFDPGISYGNADRPGISTVTPSVFSISSSTAGYTVLTITGTGFKDNNNRGGGEATGSNSGAGSPTNYPVVAVSRISGNNNEELFLKYLDFDIGGIFWDSTQTRVRFPHGNTNELPAGIYALRVIANGIPSFPSFLNVTLDCPMVADFSTDTVCPGSPMQFTDLTTGNPETCWLWDFNDGDSSFTQNAAHVFASAGTYNVKFSAGNGMGCSDTITKVIVVNPCGACDSTSFLCNSPFGVNLILNGDFEQGNAGFSTGYTLCTNPGSCVQGTYIVANNASAHHTQWTCTDHTTGSGNFMIMDGATTANVNVWCQTVTVTPNTDYSFSMWGSAMVNNWGINASDLHVFFNGVDIGNFVPPLSNVCGWTQFSTLWNSGANTSVIICVGNSTISGAGNDFAIDDLSLTAVQLPCVTDTLFFNVNTVGGTDTNQFSFLNQLPADSVLNISLSFSDTSFSAVNTISYIAGGDSATQYFVYTGPGFCTNDTVFGYAVFSAPCPTYVQDTIWLAAYYNPFCCDSSSFLCNSVFGTNLISNGDFEQGNTGFSTGYNLCASPGNCGSGDYIVANSAGDHHTGWTCTDHTSGSGQFMIFDGATTANVNVWCQTVTVNPNTDYSFSAWASTMTNWWNLNPADLHFLFNGIDLGNMVTSLNPVCGWNQFVSTWNSGSNTSVSICVANNCIEFGGNDFAIDDISLIEVQYPCIADTLFFNVNTIGGTDTNQFSFLNPLPLDSVLNISLSFSDTSFSAVNAISYIAGGDSATQYFVFTGPGFCTNDTVFGYAVFSAPCPTYVQDTVWLKAYYNPVCSTCDSISLFCNSTMGANLIVNGDFELGNTGFTTDYLLAPGSCGLGSYWVGTDAGNFGGTPSSIFQGYDHTTGNGTGYFLMADGYCYNGCSPACMPPPTKVWGQSVTVAANTYYDFSAWVANIYKLNGAAPTYGFFINGIQVGTLQSPCVATPPCWTEFSTVWNSGSVSGPVDLEIMSMTDNYIGDDMGIDDISFIPLGVYPNCVDTLYFNVTSVGGTDTSGVTLLNPLPSDSILNISLVFSDTSFSGINMVSYLAGGDSAVQVFVFSAPGNCIADTITGYAVFSDTCPTFLTDTIWLVAYYNPTAPEITAGPDTSICSGQGATISASGGDTYLWSNNDTADAISVSPNTTTTFYVTVTSSGCSAMDSVIVTVNQPSSIILQAAICVNDSIFLQGAYQTTAGTYYDTLVSVNGCDSIHITDLTVTPALTTNLQAAICNGDSIFLQGANQTIQGTYYDTLTASDGCDSVLITDLTVYQIAITNIPFSICSGDSIFLEGAYQTMAGTYSDTLTSAVGCDSIRLTALTVTPPQVTNMVSAICSGDSILLQGGFQTTSGTYVDSLSANSGCDSIVFTTLTVNPLPVFSLPDDTTMGVGNSIMLQVTATNTYSYQWSTGESTGFITVSPDETTMYNVFVTSSGGCTVEDSVEVTVDRSCVLFVPTIFTPNGDGSNDEIFVRGYGFTDLKYIIYDRWGTKVFESNDKNTGWKGISSSGSAYNTAVFVYYVEATCIVSGEIKTEKGNLTLIK